MCWDIKRNLDKKLLLLDDPDVIVTSFQVLGTFDLSQNDFTNGQLPTSLVPLEAFACKVYCIVTNVLLPLIS
jgi:hypothetical protein